MRLTDEIKQKILSDNDLSMGLAKMLNLSVHSLPSMLSRNSKTLCHYKTLKFLSKVLDVDVKKLVCEK